MTDEKIQTTLDEKVRGLDREAQAYRTKEEYGKLNEREKQVQASFWAHTFLIAELAAANRLLRNILVDKGIMTAEEDDALGDANVAPETLRVMYENTERAFYDKYQRVRFAMDNPEEVNQVMSEEPRPEGEDHERA